MWWKWFLIQDLISLLGRWVNAPAESRVGIISTPLEKHSEIQAAVFGILSVRDLNCIHHELNALRY